MRLPSRYFQPDLRAQQGYLDNYNPGFFEMAGVAFDDSFGTSSLGIIQSVMEMDAAEAEGTPMVEEEWRKSEHYRPGLEYKAGITDESAKLLAERYDDNENTQWLMERSGVLGWFGYIGGTVMGAVPDPVNLVPFGAVLKGRYLLKLGKSARAMHRAANKHTEKALGRVAMGGFEGGVGAAVLQPGLGYERSRYQEEWDLKSASLDVLAGVGAGMFFTGAIEGGKRVLSRRMLEIDGDLTDTDATVTTRADTEPPIREAIMDEMDPSESAAATRQAVQAFDNDEAPDVARVQGEEADLDADKDAFEAPPEADYYLIDQDGNVISDSGSAHRGQVQMLKEEAVSHPSQVVDWKYKKKMKLYEYTDPDSGATMYIGTRENLEAGGYEDTFNPKPKPKYTRAQQEPELDLNRPKQGDAEIDEQMQVADQQLQEQFDQRTATAEESESMRVADEESARHDEASTIIEDAANCVLNTAA